MIRTSVDHGTARGSAAGTGRVPILAASSKPCEGDPHGANFSSTSVEHIARKRFSQNFLVDAQVVADIVSAIAPDHGTVIEIGPGLERPDRSFAERVNHLHVVEIDRDIVARLRKRYPASRVTIHRGDALAFDFSALGEDLRIVGNLPPQHLDAAALSPRQLRRPGARHALHAAEGRLSERMVAEPGSGDFSHTCR